jgi:hypothetical protein
MLPGMEAWAVQQAAKPPPEKHYSGKIVASSYERYRGGAAVARRWGGAGTVTRFYVFFKEDEHDPNKWEKIEGFGPTPGDRKTFAIEEFKRRKGLA